MIDNIEVLTDKPAVCIIEVGHLQGTPATWRNKLHPTMTVCNRHKSQYDERDDLGPFDWEKING